MHDPNERGAPGGGDRDRLARLLETRSFVAQAVGLLRNSAMPYAIELGLAAVAGDLQHALAELQGLCEDLGGRIARVTADRGPG